MAKKILIAQVVILSAGLLALFVREFPGLIREIRMWRIAKLRD